jgi:hypothetical protein
VATGGAIVLLGVGVFILCVVIKETVRWIGPAKPVETVTGSADKALPEMDPE